MRFQKLEAALLAKHVDEVAICAAASCFWVPIAGEQAVGNVQHPLLGFPPWPTCSGVRILRLSVLEQQTTVCDLMHTNNWDDVLQITKGRDCPM